MTIRRARLKSNLPKAATWSAGRRVFRGTGVESTASGGAAEERRSITPALTTSKRRIHRTATPLEILTQPLQAGVRKVFDLRRFLLVLGLTIAVLALPAPPDLTTAGHRALALFVFTGAILALEPAPLPIAALLVPIGQIALGISDVNGAFSSFGEPTLFMVLGSLFLAEALRKHGLTRRLALYAIVNSGGHFPLLLLGLITIAGALSMWVLNTAIAAVLIPVAITIAQRIQPAETAQRALSLLVLSIAYASSVGGIATIMGSNENAIATGLLGTHSDFGFLDWMKYGLPVSILLLLVTWFLLLKAMPIRNAIIDLEPVKRELQRVGGLGDKEREVLIVLLISVALWVSGESIEKWLGLPPSLMNHAVIALAAVALLSIEELIDWNDLKGVNWGVFFVIGAGLALGHALEITGAGAWFADQLAPTLRGLPYWAILACLIAVGFGLTQLMNNVTLGAILAPILINLGDASGIDPARLVIPTIFAVALSFVFPVASSRMTLVAVTGVVSRQEMIRVGLVVGIPAAALLFVFFYGISLLGWI
jgi:sodium-dependent dicarboxylate transporter 2/3/5